ncbi:acyl-CoA dehydrogenase family protein [Actinacidiphila acididurans]|uniref:acyl-CoA dehydrogenase family protein n=1 Tax=Actinacidiphila acididurans TaxID=2784346 RepID=UPI0027DAB692|nr:acyl-CoA dehydrogenase [Actinacidiphila acididurans]
MTTVDEIPVAGEPLPPVPAFLREVLFEEPAGRAGHDGWRALIADGAFDYCGDLSERRSVERTYERLRLLSGTAGDPRALAADAARLAAMHEWTAVVDGSLATVAGIHYNLFWGSVLDHDPDPARELEREAALERIGTFLCTEADHGNDAAALETTAVHDPAAGGFVLTTPHPGAAKFMPNTSAAGGPKTAVVAARLISDGTDQGVFLFLVRLTDAHGPRPGVSVQALPRRTGTPVDHCLTSFDHLPLPRHALLQGPHGRLTADGGLVSRYGSRRRRFLHAIHRVTTGKLCMSACGVGGARAALAIAVAYATERRTSDLTGRRRVPLTAHRSHLDRLTRATATAYAMTFLHRAATAAWIAAQAGEGHGEEAEAERLVAVTKAWNTWRAREIVLECRERCGAHGLFPAAGLAEFPLNIEGAITAEGDNLTVWVKAAAERLTAAGPGGAPAPDPARSAAAAAGDPSALRDLMAVREAQLRTEAAALLRAAPPGDPLGRWNTAAATAMQALDAYAVLAAADAFTAATARHEDARLPGHGPGTGLLRELCALFLLEQIRPHAAELIASGHLTPQDAAALRAAAEQRCAALGPHLPDLTAAFDLPRHRTHLPHVATQARVQPLP